MQRMNIKIFVPGRLCLFGEHSDYASSYQSQNKNIEKGYAIVSCIKQGIYATVNKSNKFIFRFNNKKLDMNIDIHEMNNIARRNTFFAYVAGTAAYIIENYKVSGIEINVDKMTLPIKKGLSSSACVCVLVARAFNKLYNLNLDIKEEMEIAYQGERKTQSKCGKLDQLCAYNNKTMFVEFNNNDIKVKEIVPNRKIFISFSVLPGEKNTKKILNALHQCYPYPKSKQDENVQKTFGILNKLTIKKAMHYIKIGNIKKLGNLMYQTQRRFDKNIRPNCIEELDAPLFHQILKDITVKKYVYGGKYVGAGGNAGIQFIVKNSKCQYLLKKYLMDRYNIETYSFSIKAKNNMEKKNNVNHEILNKKVSTF